MAKNKSFVWGLILLIVPIPLLVLVLGMYGVFTFVFASLASTGSDIGTAGVLINIILGGLSLLSVVGIFVGMPFGIYLLIKSGKKPEKK